MEPSSKEILDNVKKTLKEEGVSVKKEMKLSEIISALESNADISSPMYNWTPPRSKGMKTTIQLRLKNLIVGVLNKTITRQQKFNQLTVSAIEKLSAEIQELKSKNQ